MSNNQPNQPWIDNTRKLRSGKNHTCCECDRSIYISEYYWRSSVLDSFTLNVQDYATCLPCYEEWFDLLKLDSSIPIRHGYLKETLKEVVLPPRPLMEVLEGIAASQLALE